jgi:glutamate dehydrogenase
MTQAGPADKEALLGEAAAVAPPCALTQDLRAFLDAYYRHVAAEDLAEADAKRLATVAAEQANFAASRPQGRALVRIRHGDGAAFNPRADVIDIVTDDMPYLVNSITMELTRHGIRPERVIHPQLRVRRDVAGKLRAVLGAVDATPLGAEELAESWTHIETGRIGEAEADQLTADLQRVLGDVRAAVEDFPRMRAQADQLADELAAAGEAAETQALLRWLANGHFIFLGYREYDLVDSADRPRGGPAGPSPQDGISLCPVPGTGLGILRHDKRGSTGFAALPPEVRARARDPQRLILTKANSRSTVHRPKYLDYIAVKRLDASGAVNGEYRFLGLYTHTAYSESITRIPVLRRKLENLLEATGLAPDSHDGKDLAEFLETYPRDELFQISSAELVPIARGWLRLREHPQTRLFLRRDIYRRYMSCLLYLPRDRYTTDVRLRAQDLLREALHGAQVDYEVLISESPLARLHIVVRADRGHMVPEADADDLERRIAAVVRSWDDDLAAEAARQLGSARAADLLAMCADSIPGTYKADVPPKAAVSDLNKILQMREAGQQVAFEVWESESYVGGVPADTVPMDLEAIGRQVRQGGEAKPAPRKPRVWRLTIYRAGSPVTLTEVLPRLQHMGMEVVDEHPYQFDAPGGPFWVYDFGLARSAAARAGTGPESLKLVRDLVEGALAALWRGDIEDDGLNALVLEAELTWRQVAMLRCYARYLRQVGAMFSQGYVERVLRANTSIARLLVALFETMFDPDRPVQRAERVAALSERIARELDRVPSLDQDRVLRSYWNLITATLRTSYYAAPAPYLVIKLNAAEIEELPAPRPQFELFVYSPRFEAVHLRFGDVARGGIRWSDRPEDFRTEILGLAKAQEVKNAVIVPSGAKGGFVCKQLPPAAERDAYQAEVLACYRMFIAAMLDVTDNIEAGQVVPPPRVVRRDGDDPYLVVAADKGTATFSDTANEIALSRGFWLGDAFASGGSAGYDHKKMGITARGAWQSVKYHFQTLGVDVATTDFTVAGIGDMSGDVFGNGMLLSRHIRLVAAFDHRHVFLDPDPDPEASYAERRRLFEMPRSSWADYDPSLISPGGGVWPRSAKSVPISPQAAAALGLGEDPPAALSPDQVISAILTAPVDLLWNGGIGTYVKASTQSHTECGDRSNDAVRVDASQLRCKVIGEGGNLGLTQAARIEYAMGGGLVNTDFIDNSAGVDTSDHEVNIKILLDGAVRDGELTVEARNALLHEMTGEVASLVLAHNYRQNRALAAARAQAASMLHVHARYIRKLERDGRVRRRLDGLPGIKEIADRRSAGLGLTSPEFAVLLTHTKIGAAQEVLASRLPDDPYLRRALEAYFPSALRERFAGRMPGHRLRREIITTSAVNDMVDRSGTTFAFRLNEETGASVPDITAAWLVARDVFDMAGFWSQVEALDGKVDAAVQIMLVLEGRKLTERAARWLLNNRRPPYDIQMVIDQLADGVLTVAAGLPKLLTGPDLAGFEERWEMFASRGVPGPLAERVAGMVPAYSAFDIVEIAGATGRSVDETAEVYFDLADRLGITRLRDRITALPRDDRWNTMARNALRDDLYTAHAALAKDVLAVTGRGTPEERLAAWAERNRSAVARAEQTLREIWEGDVFSIATLSVALRAIRTLVAASTLPG